MKMNFRELFDINKSSKNRASNVPNILKKTVNNSSDIKRHKLWVEKYRPGKLDEVVHQTEVVSMLRETLNTGDLPHLLLYGPPGVGKTSTILAMAMQLFGPRVYRDRVIELNASDERGINVVRNKIVTFSKTAIGYKDPKYPCPPYKIIILDEADAMTTEAQSALRKTMEENCKITRFCFICNYINQIIDPIASRCVKFRFKPLPEDLLINKLKSITACEGMELEEGAYQQLSSVSDGDMRKGIMLLQNLKYSKDQKCITKQDVCIMANSITEVQLNMIKKVCIQNRSKNISKIVNLVKQIRAFSYPIFNVLKYTHELVINEPTLNDRQKAIICLHFAKTEKRLIDGGDEYLELLSVCMCIKSVAMGYELEGYKI